MKLKKTLCLISLLQSLGLVSYISLISIIFWKGNDWFPKMNNYFGPLIMLTIFTVSALICALIALSFPFVLWQKGKTKDALKVISYTALWLVSFVIVLLLLQVKSF